MGTNATHERGDRMALGMNGIGADTISVKKKNIELITNLVEELVINKVRMENLKNVLTNTAQVKILEQELRIISDFQDAVKKLGMAELNTLAEAIREAVREGNLNKKYDFQVQIEGMDTEVEHTVLEYMDIVLRTLVDNYFEEDTIPSGDASNILKVRAGSDGKTLTVEFETQYNSKRCSDGCRALNKNLVDLVSLSDEEMNVFFSFIDMKINAEQLKWVKSNLAVINGSITFESLAGGTRQVTVSIPLITAVMKGMLVTIGSQTMVLPSNFIEAIVRPKNITNFEENRRQGQVIYLDHTVPIIDLGDLMDITEDRTETTILIVSANGTKVALVVDSIIDQTDLVIKPKHSILNTISEVRGTTVLGNGDVIMVLDIPAIIKNKVR